MAGGVSKPDLASPFAWNIAVVAVVVGAVAVGSDTGAVVGVVVAVGVVGSGWSVSRRLREDRLECLD